MHVQPLTSEDALLLADFVGGHFEGSVEQTWAWGELQTQIPGRPAFRVFGLFEGEKLVGSMLVIRQAMGFGKTWLWAPRGPLLPEKKAAIAWGLLQEACGNWARLHGDVFLRVEPGFLRSAFDLGGDVARESYMPSDTLVLDLSLPPPSASLCAALATRELISRDAWALKSYASVALLGLGNGLDLKKSPRVEALFCWVLVPESISNNRGDV